MTRRDAAQALGWSLWLALYGAALLAAWWLR